MYVYIYISTIYMSLLLHVGDLSNRDIYIERPTWSNRDKYIAIETYIYMKQQRHIHSSILYTYVKRDLHKAKETYMKQ